MIAEKVKKKLGERVRQLRKAKRLSQEKFSFQCDLDRTYIASIEAGKRNVSLVNLQKISAAFGLTLKEFFDWD